MKTNFEVRPIFLSKEETIKGHFLICFLALTIQRYLEFILDCCGYSMPTKQIIELIKKQKISIVPNSKTYIRSNEPEEFKNVLKVLGLESIKAIGNLDEVKFSYIQTKI